MSLSLPYSANRRYLSGIDWIINAQHKHAGAGVISQAILDLDGRLDETLLREALGRVSRRFPILHGRARRDVWNLCPYWKVAATARHVPTVASVELPDGGESEAEKRLADHVNTPLREPYEHVRFLVVHLGGRRTRLGMVFDHRLFDAFGAEAFLRLLDVTAAGKLEEVAPQIKTAEPAHLDHWERRFDAGRKMGDYFDTFKQRKVSRLRPPIPGRRPRVAFVKHRLTSEQSTCFIDQAACEIRMPILLPSALARAMLALRQSTQFSPGECLAYSSLTSRVAGREWEDLFFNPYTFVLFSADVAADPTPGKLALCLRDQLVDMMRINLPAVMRDATALGRIAPLWLVSVLRQLHPSYLCTVYFACLRETGLPARMFLGQPVSNLTHTPLAFYPPGINICMTWYADAFNLVISYLEGCLDERSAEGIMRAFAGAFE